MGKSKAVKLFRKLHKWPGIIISVIAIHFALSGVIMNHRELVSGIDVSRKFLPTNYTYENWNLASVKGGFPLTPDSMIFYGNIGCWIKTGDTYRDFNRGFPKGIDNRKVSSILRFNNTLVAGTQFGLFARNERLKQWEEIKFPKKEQYISDLFIKNDTLIILSRNTLIKTRDLQHFKIKQLPPAIGYKKKVGLFKTLWELHSGELFGIIGKLFVDLLGVVTVILSLTGILHFLFPGWVKRKRKRTLNAGKLPRYFRLNLKWHNKLGYILAVFLIINTMAGMFLRPPLLIPIIHKEIPILPGTHLDTSNPWHDKLRKGEWNEKLSKYIFSTSDGFYYTDENLTHVMKKFLHEPPVSIMGCNVLEPINEKQYLVGSFSGMFIWSAESGQTFDFFTRKPFQKTQGMSRPVSEHMVTGFIHSPTESWYFDYNTGMTPITKSKTWPMPESVLDHSPISLWNLALEMHTGRIFEFLLGFFYFLYVPLAGLCLLSVLFSGFFLWYFGHRKQKN